MQYHISEPLRELRSGLVIDVLFHIYSSLMDVSDVKRARYESPYSCSQ